MVWVLAPFALLAVGNLVSKRWPERVRAVLYIVTIFVTVASVAIYFDNNVAHRTAKPAFFYVAVPPVSVLVSAIIVALAAVKTRRL